LARPLCPSSSNISPFTNICTPAAAQTLRYPIETHMQQTFESAVAQFTHLRSLIRQAVATLDGVLVSEAQFVLKRGADGPVSDAEQVMRATRLTLENALAEGGRDLIAACTAPDACSTLEQRLDLIGVPVEWREKLTEEERNGTSVWLLSLECAEV
jgi:hypothetical protein